MSQPLQVDPQVGVVDGRARVQFDDLFKALHRPLILLQLKAAEAQEVVGLLEVGVQFPGLGKGPGGVRKGAQVPVAEAQMDIDAGQLVGRRVEGEGPAEVLQGLLGALLVFQGQTQEEMDVEAVRKGGVEVLYGR